KWAALNSFGDCSLWGSIAASSDGRVFHTIFDHAVELIDFWKYHDTGPSIFGPVGRGLIVYQGNVVATSGSGHPFWVDPKIVLKDPDHGSRTFDTKVPVVQDDAIASVGHIVGMAFDHKLKIRFVVHHHGHFAQYFFCGIGHVVASAPEQ